MNFADFKTSFDSCNLFSIFSLSLKISKSYGIVEFIASKLVEFIEGKSVEKPSSKLLKWIRNSGLTVEYFAFKIKIDKSYIYKWAKGLFIPSEKILKRIKRATLGAISKVEDLLGD